MSRAFAQSVVDAEFAHAGDDALYAAPGAAPAPCKVRIVNAGADRVEAPGMPDGMGALPASGETLYVRVSEISDLAKGAVVTLTASGQRYRIAAEAVARDAHRLVWMAPATCGAPTP